MNGTEYNNQFTQEELKSEIWKDVVGYEGLYKVSNLGRVKSLDRVVTCKDGKRQLYKGKFIKFDKNRGNYVYANLCKNGIRKNKSIHQLVAQAFIPNPNNLPEVNHIDEDKSNNRVDNLEWCDRKYNINYGTRNKRAGISNAKPVIMYDKKGNKLKEFDSMLSAGRYLCIPKEPQGISKCCKGKCKSAYGYMWKYK